MCEDDKAAEVRMGLFDIVELRDDLPPNFEDDGIELTPEMIEKYRRARIGIKNGQMKSRKEYFCKDASIFDLTGTKIAWGDITPKDVEGMLGVYYVLSRHKSFWNPDEETVKGWRPKTERPQSRFRHLQPDFEPVVFQIKYVKKNAIARIVDGEIQTSRDLIYGQYQ